MEEVEAFVFGFFFYWTVGWLFVILGRVFVLGFFFVVFFANVGKKGNKRKDIFW